MLPVYDLHVGYIDLLINALDIKSACWAAQPDAALVGYLHLDSLHGPC